MLETALSALGFDLQNLVAGLAGGICAAFILDRYDPWDVVGSITVGGLSGNYVAGTRLAVLASEFFGTPHSTPAFVVGVIAIPLCKCWITEARRRTK